MGIGVAARKSEAVEARSIEKNFQPFSRHLAVINFFCGIKLFVINGFFPNILLVKHVLEVGIEQADRKIGCVSQLEGRREFIAPALFRLEIGIAVIDRIAPTARIVVNTVRQLLNLRGFITVGYAAFETDELGGLINQIGTRRKVSPEDVAPVHAAAERSDPLIIDKVFAFHEARERRLIERFAC